MKRSFTFKRQAFFVSVSQGLKAFSNIAGVLIKPLAQSASLVAGQFGRRFGITQSGTSVVPILRRTCSACGLRRCAVAIFVFGIARRSARSTPIEFFFVGCVRRAFANVGTERAQSSGGLRSVVPKVPTAGGTNDRVRQWDTEFRGRNAGRLCPNGHPRQNDSDCEQLSHESALNDSILDSDKTESSVVIGSAHSHDLTRMSGWAEFADRVHKTARKIQLTVIIRLLHILQIHCGAIMRKIHQNLTSLLDRICLFDPPSLCIINTLRDCRNRQIRTRRLLSIAEQPLRGEWT